MMRFVIRDDRPGSLARVGLGLLIVMLVAGCDQIVTKVASVESLSFSPGTVQLDVGATIRATAVLRDARGRPLGGRPIVWSSSAPDVATVSDTGEVTGVGAGVTTIRAETEGAVGSLSVEVPLRRIAVSVNGLGRVTNSTANIACPQVCAGDVPSGTRITLRAAPSDSDWAFAGWSGACSGAEVLCSLEVKSDLSAGADFRLIGKRLTVRKLGAGQGTVGSASGQIDCGSICTAVFPTGTRVTLVADADVDSRFDRWGGGCSGLQSQCDVWLTEDREVSATFSRNDNGDQLIMAERWDGPDISTANPWGRELPSGGFSTLDLSVGQLVWSRANAPGEDLLLAALDLGSSVDFNPELRLVFDLLPTSSRRSGGLNWAALVSVRVRCFTGQVEDVWFAYDDVAASSTIDYDKTDGSGTLKVVGLRRALGTWNRRQEFRLGDYVKCGGRLTRIAVGGRGTDFSGGADNLAIWLPGPGGTERGVGSSDGPTPR